MDCTQINYLLKTFSLVQSCDIVRDGSLRLSTGLSYPDGSHIDVFYCKPDDLIALPYVSDLGQTAAYLADLNIYPYKNQKRRRIITSICRTLGIKDEGGEYRISLSPETSVGDAIVRLAQCCVRVADLCYTQRYRNDSTFKDDFEGFLADVPLAKYESDVPFRGRFDSEVLVDFVAYGHRSRNLILTLSTQTSAASHNVALEAFRKWYDLAPERDNFGFVSVYDSRTDVFKPEDITRLGEVSSVVAYPAEEDSLKSLLES